jgi:hypothetical protein
VARGNSGHGPHFCDKTIRGKYGTHCGSSTFWEDEVGK